MLAGGGVGDGWNERESASSRQKRSSSQPGALSAFRKNVEKRWLLENMDGAFLVLDEIVDGG